MKRLSRIAFLLLLAIFLIIFINIKDSFHGQTK